MKILILQNDESDGPAYLATFLRSRNVSYETIFVGNGAALPATLSAYDGLAILGGPNSVNDVDPTLRRVEALIREARGERKPVIGHCLGGQLIASALGGAITTHRQPEIGWTRVTLADSDEAREWFGEYAGTTRDAFEWHYETFSLPSSAQLLAGNEVCAHQAFAIDTLLAMQFHIEVDYEKLTTWAATSNDELMPLRSLDTVQLGAEFLEQSVRKLPGSHALADRIYSRFLTLAQRFARLHTA
jgi:GMP synthase (glutamine-hydrolysing)